MQTNTTEKRGQNFKAHLEREALTSVIGEKKICMTKGGDIVYVLGRKRAQDGRSSVQYLVLNRFNQHFTVWFGKGREGISLFADGEHLDIKAVFPRELYPAIYKDQERFVKSPDKIPTLSTVGNYLADILAGKAPLGGGNSASVSKLQHEYEMAKLKKLAEHVQSLERDKKFKNTRLPEDFESKVVLEDGVAERSPDQWPDRHRPAQPKEEKPMEVDTPQPDVIDHPAVKRPVSNVPERASEAPQKPAGDFSFTRTVKTVARVDDARIGSAKVSLRPTERGNPTIVLNVDGILDEDNLLTLITALDDVYETLKAQRLAKEE